MNLNYDQSPETLQALLATANEELPTHHIVVDYDGEVIIDPELRYPNVDVKRYKYSMQIWNATIRSANKVQELHTRLMNVLNGTHSMGRNDLNIAA